VFETLALVDCIILTCKGHRLSRVRPNGGGLLAFEFDGLTEQQASAILNSTDASLCRSFHRSWRDVRRRMDAVTTQEAQR
jgi:hypothetical protein